MCYSVLSCFSRSVLCHYVWHSLTFSPQTPASTHARSADKLKDAKFTRFNTARQIKNNFDRISSEAREKKRNFKFISRRWKSEHLTENLSNSLNIYVDLFQLIDFLSMLLQKYVFCNAIREKKSKRKIYLLAVMLPSCFP